MNVSVLEYVPVRSGSVAFTSCLKAMSTMSFVTGAVQDAFEKETRIVIATYHEGPISVLPLKVAETPTPATAIDKP